MIQKGAEKCFFTQDIYIYFFKPKTVSKQKKYVNAQMCLYRMFVSPDQKKDLCISSIQIVLIKDKIKRIKRNKMYFFLVFIRYFLMFSAILIKWQKNENFRTEKLSADPNSGRKNFRTKKNPKSFSVQKFSFVCKERCDIKIGYIRWTLLGLPKS